MLTSSKISIPASTAFVRPVTAYAVELARLIGFDSAEVGQIHVALEESLLNVVKFGYEEASQHTFDVVFEPQPIGMVIRIQEKGIPFNPERLPDYQPDHPEMDATGASLGVYLVKTLMDETAFVRKGREGQEIRLTKYLKKKHIHQILAPSERTPSYRENTHSKPADAPPEFSIRPMRLEEALEVSKCAYRCYGYTYEDYVYYPERLAAMNEDGNLYSLVAVTTDHRIMGHAALKYPYPSAVIAESGVAFVYPQYRKLGLFSKFNDLFIETAPSKGLYGLYGRAVTSHVASQKMAARHGYKDCGVFLGMFPETTDFKKMSGKVPQRESSVLSFLSTKTAAPRDVYVPESYRSLTEKIFQAVGVPVHFPEMPRNRDPIPSTPSNLEIKRMHDMNSAEMVVHDYGENAFHEIRLHLKDLCLERIDVLHVILDLENASTPAVAGQLESLGLFFGGILPFGLTGRHALILQYLNNVKIDFNRINLVHPEALAIRDAIKKRVQSL